MKTRDLLELKDWFLAERRELPWRQTNDPYAIWVSEIMLQQTRVAVVISYFQRWMEQFPTVQQLADASLNEVLKAWEGLGYYSRARQLHAGAKYIAAELNGKFPDSEEGLSKIKGLGPYTIGAILNFAFHQRIPAVDGNVLRVLSRYNAIEEDISKTKTIKQIRSMTQDLLPHKEPWIISEALIELGATICGRKPKCMQCPLNLSCKAHLRGIADQLPIKPQKAVAIQLYRAVAILVKDRKICLTKGNKGTIMADLYEFPYFELNSPKVSVEQLTHKLISHFGDQIAWNCAFPQVKHSFTKYRAELYPHLFHVQENHLSLKSSSPYPFEWHDLEFVKNLPFSSGHKRILQHLFHLQKSNDLIAGKLLENLGVVHANDIFH